jgi:hypothetical protein
LDGERIFLIILIIGLAGFSVYIGEHNSNAVQISDVFELEPSSYPQILGNTDYGYVIRGGPYGNKDSEVKIAYIIGVHPLEFKSHEAILDVLLNNQHSLKYSYYIYMIKVTRDASDYNNGRINGQLLAYEYAFPDIEAKKFNLVVDVHSNIGDYKEKRFLDVPVNDNISKDLAYKILNKISWASFYIPPAEKGPSSGPYVILPLIHYGIPTIVYETYRYEPYKLTLEHANQLIEAVDRLNL